MTPPPTPPLNPSNIQTPTITPAPKKLDYMGLRLSGVDNNSILDYSAKTNQVPTMLSKEDAWSKYGESVYGNDKMKFGLAYDSSNEAYNAYNTSVHEGTMQKVQYRSNDAIPSNVSTPFSRMEHGYSNFAPPTSQKTIDDRFIGSATGAYTQIKSDEIFADGRNIVSTKDGNVSKDEYYRNQLHRMSGGTDKTSDVWFNSALFAGTMGLAKQDESAHMLALDYDEQGLPIWRDKSLTESLKGSTIRSAWGSRTMHNNWFEDIGGTAVNEFVTNVPSIFGSLAETGMYLVKGQVIDPYLAHSGISPKEQKSFDEAFANNPLMRWANIAQNVSSAGYFNESQNQQRGLEGTSGRMIGGAIGMMLQAVATGGIGEVGGLLKGGIGLSDEAFQLSAKIAIDEGKSPLIAELHSIARQGITKNVSERLNRGFFTIAMADGFHQGAKEMGISPEKAAMGYLGSAVTTYALMGIGHKWFSPATSSMITRQSTESSMKDIVKETFMDYSKKMFPDVAPAELTGTQIDAVVKETSKGVFRKMAEAAKKGGNALLNGRIVPVSNIASATSEMGLIHMANNSIQIMQDYYSKYAGDDTSGIDGMYGDVNENVFSRITNGLGGALENGLLMGAISTGIHFYKGGKLMSPQEQSRRMTLGDATVNNMLPELEKTADAMYKNGEIGAHWANAKTGEVIRDGEIDPQTGVRPTSIADESYSNFKQDIRNYKKIYDESGLKKWNDSATKDKYIKKSGTENLDAHTSKMLDELVDPNMLAREGIEHAVNIRDLNKKLVDAKTDLEKSTIKKQLDIANEKLNDIITDKRSNEIIRDGIVRDYIADTNKAYDYGSSGVKEAIALQKKEGFHKVVDVFNTSVSNGIAKFLNDKNDAEETMGNAISQIKEITSSISKGNNEKIVKVASDLVKTGSVAAAEHLANLNNGIKAAAEKHINETISDIKAKHPEEVKNVEVDPEDEPMDTLEEHIRLLPDSAKGEFKSRFDDIHSALGIANNIANMKPEARTQEQVKTEAFLSSNVGTSQDPILKSFESSIKDFKESNLSTIQDAHLVAIKLEEVQSRILAMLLNKEAYSKLSDSTSGLNDVNRAPDSYYDEENKDSVISKLNDYKNQLLDIVQKSSIASESARLDNEANVKIGFINNANRVNSQIIENLKNFYPDNAIILGTHKTIDEFNNLVKQISDIKTAAGTNEDGTSKITFEDTKKVYDIHDRLLESIAKMESQIHIAFKTIKGSAETIHTVFFKEGIEGNYSYDPGFGGLTDVNYIQWEPETFDKTGTRLFPLYNSSQAYHEVRTGESNCLPAAKAYLYKTVSEHLHRIMRISSKEFLDNYKNYIDRNVKLDPKYIVPSFEQRQAIHTLVAFMNDSNNLYVDHPNKTQFVRDQINVLGYAGAGKTTLVVPSAIHVFRDILESRESKSSDSLKLVGTAPSNPQITNLSDAFKSSGLKDSCTFTTIDDILNEKGILSKEKPSFLIVDEASELNAEELAKMTSIARDNGIKIIHVCDPSQLGDIKDRLEEKERSSQIPDVMYNRESTTPIVDVFRSGVFDISRLQQQYRDVSLYANGKQVSLLQTQYTVDSGGRTRSGVVLRGYDSKTISEQMGKFASDLKTDGVIRTGTVMIVANDSDRLSVIDELSKNHGIDRKIAENAVKTIIRGEFTAKGLSFPRVYVNIDKEKLGPDYNKAQLTAVSRAKEFADVVTDVPTNSLPGSREVSQLIDENADYIKLEDERKQKYALSEQSRLSSMSEALKGIDVPKSNVSVKSTKVTSNKKTVSQDDFEVGKKYKASNGDIVTVESLIANDDGFFHVKLSGYDKPFSPLGIHSLGLVKIVNARKGSILRTRVDKWENKKNNFSVGGLVRDENNVTVRISSIAVDAKGNYYFKISGSDKEITKTQFLKKYKSFKANDITIFNTHSDNSATEEMLFATKSIQNHKNGLSTYSSATNPFGRKNIMDSNMQVLHDRIKMLVLNKSGAFNGYSKLMLKRTYHQSIELNGKMMNDVVTVSLDLADNAMRDYLGKQLKNNNIPVTDENLRRFAIMGTMFMPNDKANHDFNGEYKAPVTKLIGETDDQFTDRVAYEKYKFDIRKKAYQSNEKVVDLGYVAMKSATPGNVNYNNGSTNGKVAFSKMSDLLKDHVATSKGGKIYKSGNVYFYEPIFIDNPDKLDFTVNSPSLKGNGKFEPGYYLMYSHDETMTNIGMVKLRSQNLSNAELQKTQQILRERFDLNKSNAEGSPSQGKFWEPINNFVSGNRYAFFSAPSKEGGEWKINPLFTEEGLKKAAAKTMSPQEIAEKYDGIGDLVAMKIDKKTTPGKATARFNFKYFDGNYGGKVTDLDNVSIERKSNALADAIKIYTESKQNVALRDFALIDPTNSHIAEKDFNKLEANIAGFNMPQILTSSDSIANETSKNSKVDITNAPPADPDEANVRFDFESHSSTSKEFEEHIDFVPSETKDQRQADSIENVSNETTSNSIPVEKEEISRNKRAQDFGKLLDIFDNNQYKINEILLNIGGGIVDLSSYSRKIFPKRYEWNAAVNRYYERLTFQDGTLKNKKYIVVRDGAEQTVGIDDLRYTDSSSISNANTSRSMLSDYIVHQLSKEENFEKFIKKIFPKAILFTDAVAKEIPMSDFAQQLKGAVTNILSDKDESSSQSSIQIGNDLKAPSFSDHVRLILGSIRLNSYDIKDDGSRKMNTRGTAFINVGSAETLLINASRIARSKNVGNPDRDSMREIGKVIKQMAIAGMPGNRLTNLAWSVYDSIFNDSEHFENKESATLGLATADMVRPDGDISYTMWAKYPSMVHEFLSDVDNTKFDLDEQIIPKSIDMHTVLSAIHYNYDSIVQKNVSEIILNRDNSAYVRQRHGNDLVKIKEGIKTAFRNGMFDFVETESGKTGELKPQKKQMLFDTFKVTFMPPNGNKAVTSIFTQDEINEALAFGIKIDPKNITKQGIIAGYRNTASGLSQLMPDGELIPLISYDKNGARLNPSFNVDTANSLLKFLNLGWKHISPKTIDAFLQEKDSHNSIKMNSAIEGVLNTKLSDGGINRNKFAEIIKTWMDQLTDKNIKKQHINSVISTDSEEANSSFVGDGINDESETIGSADVKHWLLDDIAAIQSYSRASTGSEKSITIGGERIYLETKGSAFDYQFGGFTDKISADDGIKSEFSFKFAAAQDPDASAYYAPGYDEAGNKTGRFLNPFLDKNNKDLVLKSYTRMAYLTKGSKTIPVSKMQNKEYLNAMINAFFIDNIVQFEHSGSKNVKLIDGGRNYHLPTSNMADTHTPIVMNFETSIEHAPLRITVKDGEYNASVNWDTVSQNIIDLFTVRERHSTKALGTMESIFRQNIDPTIARSYDELAMKKENRIFNERSVSPEFLQRMIDDHINTPGHANEFLSKLKEGYAEVYSHYKFVRSSKEGENDRILLGNDANMEFTNIKGELVDDVFTMENHREIAELAKIDDIKTRNMLVEMKMKKILSKRMNGFVDHMVSTGIKVNPVTEKFFQGDKSGLGSVRPFKKAPKDSMKIGYETNDIHNPNEQKKMLYMNPFYEAYYLSWLTHNAHVSEITGGNPFAQSGWEELGKRNYSLLTPGNHLDVTNPNGIGRYSQYAIIDDSVATNDVVRFLTDTSPSQSRVQNTDGWQLKLSAHAWLEYISSGNGNGSITKENINGSQKHIYNDIDLLTGQRRLIKSSALMTAAQRKHSLYIRDLEKRMLGPELYSKLVEFNFDDEKLAHYIIDNNLQETYTAALVPKSSFKLAGDSPINSVDANGFQTFRTDNSKHLIILDANKDYKDDSSKMQHQLLNTMFDGPQNKELANRVKTAQASIVDYRLNKMIDKVKDKYDGNWGAYLKDLGKESAQNMGLLTNFVNIITDSGFSIHSPGIAERIRPLLIQQLNEMIKPEFNTGGSHVQAPGDFIDMMDVNENIRPDNALFLKQGQSFTKFDYDKNIEMWKKNGVDENSFTPRTGLHYTRHFTKDGIDIESLVAQESRDNPNWKPSVEERNHLISQIHSSKSAEAIIQFKDPKKFGFSLKKENPLYYKNFSVNDIMTIHLSDGRLIRYDHLGDTVEERMTNLKSLIPDIDFTNSVGAGIVMKDLVSKGEIKLPTEATASVESNTNQIDPEKLFPAIKDYYEGFHNYLDNIMSRIPASSSGSGNKYRTVDFSHETTNIAFTSSKKNVIDGSDYDIDELHSIGKFVGNMGKSDIIGDDGKVIDSDKMNMNVIVNSMFDYYDNTLNVINYTTPITTNTIQDIISNLKLDERGKNEVSKFINDFTSNSKQFASYQAGANVTGILASAIRTTIYLNNAYADVKGNHFKMVFRGSVFGGKTFTRFTDKDGNALLDNGQYKITWLGQLLQSAVDNNQLDQLGKIMINPSTSNMVTALCAVGADPENSIRMLTHGTTRMVLRDFMVGQGLGDMARNKYHVVESWNVMFNSYQERMSDIQNDAELSAEDKNAQMIDITEAFRKAAWLGNRSIPVTKLKSYVTEEGYDASKSNDEDISDETFTSDDSMYYDEDKNYEGGYDDTVDSFSNRDEKGNLIHKQVTNYNFSKVDDWIEKKKNDIADIHQLMVMSDAMGSLSRALSIAGSKGIRSNSFELYQYMNDLNETRGKKRDFLESRPTKPMVNGMELPTEIHMGSKDIPSEKAIYDDNFEKMRKFIDFNRVLNHSQNITSYLKLLDFSQDVLSKSIIYENPIIKQGVLNRSRSMFNQDRIWTKENYNKIFGSVNNLLTNMYINEKYSSGAFDKRNMSSQIDSNGKLIGELYISSPIERSCFLSQITSLMDDIIANPEKFNKNNPSAISDNIAIQNMMVNTGKNMDKYIIMHDSMNYSDSTKSMITDAFKRLDDAVGFNLTERLAMYQLIKNSFMFHQGDLTDFLPNEHMKDFDQWLAKKANVLSSGQGSEFDALSKQINDRLDNIAIQFQPKKHPLTKPIPGFKDTNFGHDYVEDADETGYGGKIFANSREKNNGNELYKLSSDYPDFIVTHVHDAGQHNGDGARRILQLNRETMEYKPVYNKYKIYTNSWESDALTSMRTLSELPNHSINELLTNANHELRIKVPTRSYYKNGEYQLNGILVNVQRDGKSHIFISVPLNKSAIDFELSNHDIDSYIPDYADKTTDEKISQDHIIKQTIYDNATTKMEALESIAQHSIREPFRLLAQAISESDYAGKLESGKYDHVDGSHPLLSSVGNVANSRTAETPTEINRTVGGYYNPDSDHIVINSTKVNSARSFERVFLHETIHNVMHDVFRKSKSELNEMELEFVDKVDQMRAKMQTYLAKNKLMYEVNGIKYAFASHNAFKNSKEFMSEAFSSPLIQEQMLRVESLEPKKTGRISIWNDFVNSVKDFFSNSMGSKVEYSIFEELVHTNRDFIFEKSRNADYPFTFDGVGDAFSKNEIEFSVDEHKQGDYHEPVGKLDNEKDLIIAMSGADFSDRNADKIGTMKSLSQFARKLDDGKFEYVTTSGKSYKINNPSDTSELEKIAERIIKDRDAYEPIMRENVLDYIVKRSDRILDQNLERNRDVIDRNFKVYPNDSVVLFDDIKKTIPTMSFFSSNFNPIITSSINDGVKYISIQDITNKNLNMKLVHSNTEQHIADILLRNEKDVTNNMNLRLSKTEGGMRKFNVILSAMLMKAHDPSIVFDNLFVAKLGGQAEVHGVEISDYIDEMKTILTNKSVYDNLPVEIRNAIDSKGFFDTETYGQNYVKSLINSYTETKEMYHQLYEMGEHGAYGKEQEYSKFLDKIHPQTVGNDLTTRDIERLIKERINFITDKFNGNEQLMNNDKNYGPEMSHLSKALRYIQTDGSKLSDAKMGVDLWNIDKMWKMSYNVMHPIMQWYRKEVMQGINTALNNFMNKFRSQFTIELDKFNESYSKSAMDVLVDRGYKRFDKLFIKGRAVSKAGVHDVNTYNIHYSYINENGIDQTPQVTKDAIATGKLSKKEAEFGGFIVKSIKDSMIKRMMNNGLEQPAAREWYNNNWTDGRMPVMSRRASEKIFTKDWKSGLTQYLTKFSSGGEIYDFVAQSKENNPNKISDHFMFQAGAGIFGSQSREQIIGLKSNRDNGNIEVIGNTDSEIAANLQKNQSDVEQNLETLMYYFMMNHHTKEALDKVMPVHYAALNIIHNFEQSEGKALPNLKAYIQAFTKFIVKGERDQSDAKIILLGTDSEGNKRSVKVDDLINNVSGFTATMAIGLNVFADTKNFITNNLNIMSFANSNSLAKSKTFFSVDNVNHAIKKISSNNGKKLAMHIGWIYRSSGMDRSSMANNKRFSDTSKTIGNFYSTYGQFAGDYQARTLVWMAQMDKLGCLDAHSIGKDGELVYDEKLDKRLYDSSGKLTENGKALKFKLLNDLFDEGVYDGPITEDAKLPRALNAELMEGIKTMTDKYIMGGGYNDASRNPADAHSFGKLLLTMKRYITDKAQNVWSVQSGKQSAMGDYIFVDKMVNGKMTKVAIYDGIEMEGILNSFGELYKECKRIGKGDYSGFKEMWNAQGDVRKLNVVQTLHNALVVAAFMSLAPAIFGDDDDERNKRHDAFMRTKMFRSLQYSFADLISGINPMEYYGAIQEPIFAINKIGQVGESLYALGTLDAHKINLAAGHMSGMYSSMQAAYNTVTGETNDSNKKSK